MRPFIALPDVYVYQADCRDVMAALPENSIDAIVTDPPYALSFMGKDWDTIADYYEWCLSWAQEAYAVLKPGGHMLVFSGTRTHHRLWCAVEDAGFEVRDMILWAYGTGFPKSLDIGKAIDKMAGAQREITGVRWTRKANEVYGSGKGTNTVTYDTAPATDVAQKWQGWGTALKPAIEPVLLARKPLSEPSVAANVLRWGTGAINIDGCRIETSDGYQKYHNIQGINTARTSWEHRRERHQFQPAAGGRFPANLVVDEEAAALLDEQSGHLQGQGSLKKKPTRGKSWQWEDIKQRPDTFYGDSGGASRFFYCAKASNKERHGSKHPTVKPLKLMRYLVRLVTPPGGVVLDPFAGTGTTLEAALLEGFRAAGVELESAFCGDIRKRLEPYA